MMRRVWLVVAAVLLSGCTGGLAERHAELSHWIGQPESQLIAAMGAPHRVYDSGGMKFLTYQEVEVQREPAGGYYFGPGPAAPTGFGGPRLISTCETTFTVSGGVVRAFSLRGGGCG
jgi:hypothetical protein